MPKIEYFARHFGPALEELFFDHRAPDFEPTHKIATTPEVIA
jgi:hypothetical protein